MSPGKAYTVPVLSGFLSGWLCRVKWLPLHKFRLPTFILRSFQIFAPLFRTDPPSAHRRERVQRAPGLQRNTQGYQDQLIPGGRPDIPAGLQQRRRVAAPTEEAIAQLMTLGFDREQVSHALMASNNNVETAANRLLNA